MCPQAYCEDHLPLDAEIVGQCERFEKLGQKHPAQVGMGAAFHLLFAACLLLLAFHLLFAAFFFTA
jgi:hypothetical protein